MSNHEIEIEYGERYTDFVMGMLGWNLCDCDDVKFQKMVGECQIVSELVKRRKVNLMVEFDGKDEELKEKVIEDFKIQSQPHPHLSNMLGKVRMGVQSLV